MSDFDASLRTVDQFDSISVCDFSMTLQDISISHVKPVGITLESRHCLIKSI